MRADTIAKIWVVLSVAEKVADHRVLDREWIVRERMVTLTRA